MSYNISDLASTAHQGFNYVFAGVSSHLAGEVIELLAMPILQSLPGGAWIKIPAAKILHEIAECFFSSSSIINMYKNEDGLWEAVKHITKPVWSTPGETVFAGITSYVFEQVAISYLGLEQCTHAHGGHAHNHHHESGIFTSSNLIKGLASTAGSLIGSNSFEKAEDLYDYFFANNASNDTSDNSQCCIHMMEFDLVVAGLPDSLHSDFCYNYSNVC